MAPRFMRELIPRREKRAPGTVVVASKNLTWVQWAQFWSGWIAWTCDAIDFFAVSLTVTPLATQFNQSITQITTAITLTLLFRPVGAIIFGILSDRFGRKWPLVFNLLLCCVFELGTGFVNTFPQFLAVRALFGIAMGGIWGLSTASALENLPVELRGIASGVLQEGYAVGYLIAAVINLTLVAQHGWRVLFWTGAGISFFAAVIRAFIPESAFFLRAKEQERARGTNTSQKTKVFIKETKEILKRHWLLIQLLASRFTVATIIGNCGAIAGGIIAGSIFVLLIEVFIPLWVLPSSLSALSAGAFCIQVGVQGALGVIPIQLAEMSPPAFRATFPGVAYQIGNMISSASAQIEATGGDNLKTTIMENGVPTQVPNYATVQAIFIGVVAAFVVVITIIGPENHGSHFENHKTAFEEGGGRDDAVADNASYTSYREVDEKSSAQAPNFTPTGQIVVYVYQAKANGWPNFSMTSNSGKPAISKFEVAAERLTLPDGQTAHRVPAPCNPLNPTIPFYDNGTPGVSVKNSLKGGCVQGSPEPDFKAGSLKVVFQWPGYDSPNVPHPRHITITSNTKQELTVTGCTELHKFYSSLVVGNTLKNQLWSELTKSQKMTPSAASRQWAFSSRVRLGDIILMSLHFDAGVWVPEFYVRR
ncbi:major facilitator superfamily domain-containing protein [Suillus cothurnatus]|nr:major facilitator superfamily domain-containing protein [Suillus cothurnatus]